MGLAFANGKMKRRGTLKVDRTATLERDEVEVGSALAAEDTNVRRFTSAVTIGGILVAVPYLWILTDLWTRSPSLLRTTLPHNRLSNFYDLQARAMMHGHLYVPNGSLGAEAFVHGGRQFTYFGLFPSLLRIPILLMTHRLDGRLSAVSILMAWLITGMFSSMLLWRVRLIVRGPALLGRSEAAAYGALVASILGGSVLVNLASTPWVYSEDIAWSIALTVGALFALLGVLEAPSWGRVAGTGALILGVTLTRGSTGAGCVIGAVLSAAWFASGHAGKQTRHWWWPILIAGVVPLSVATAVSWAKFGVLYGYPLHDQIYFNTQGLNHINGSYFGLRYLPTTIATYLGGLGLHLSLVFPFITLPMHPAQAIAGVPLFGTEEVTSVPGSMPLLFVLTIWGSITAFRRRPTRRARLTAILLFAAAVPCGIILVFGFLDDRFLGDFVPFLVVGAAVGMVDIWRRLEGRRLRIRQSALGIVVIVTLFSVAANTAMASTPTGWWSKDQALRFVEFQKSVSDLTGFPLTGNVLRGTKLPDSAPIDELFVASNCAGLFVFPSTGIEGWLEIETEPPYRHTLDVTIRGTTPTLEHEVPLVTVGTHSPQELSMVPDGVGQVRFVLRSAAAAIVGPPMHVELNKTYRLTVDTDLTTDWLSVTSQSGDILLEGFPSLQGPIVVHASDSQFGGPPMRVSVVDVTQPASRDSLCGSIVSGS